MQFKNSVGSGSNVDTITTPGKYQIQTPSGLPSGANGYGILYVNDTTSFKQQYYVPDGGGTGAGLWIRSIYLIDNTDFTNVDWVRVDNFGCNTPSALASLLGGVQWSVNTTLRDCNSMRIGIYYIYQDTTNRPTNMEATYGMCLSFVVNTSYGIQLLFDTTNAKVWHRILDSGTWQSWTEF